MNDKTGRRDFLKTMGAAGAGLAAMGASAEEAPRTAAGATVAGFAAPPLETVRAGVIGVGSRGSSLLGLLLGLDGVEIKAICDTHAPAAAKSRQRCVDEGRPAPDAYTDGDHAYRKLLARDDIDMVLICTPWQWHSPMCLDAMRAGKHAFTEVPAALTVEECWQLVDTAEREQKHCMMMENVCYGREELMVLNMCRQGLFGELTHGEAAYIHDLRGQMRNHARGTGSWRTLHWDRRNGNLYPTHGLGPVAQYMNINRGDRFDYLTSLSSPSLSRPAFTSENLPEDHPFRSLSFAHGADMNTSLIKTVQGRSIMVQWDTATPRPYSRLNLIQGTRGAFGGFPDRIVVEGRGNTHAWTQGEALEPYRTEFEHPLWTRVGEEARKAGGHGGMDFIMLWRIIYCLRNGEPMDQDVYDAAAWSAVGPLSEQSVARRSSSVDVPDFTRGRWKTMEPLGIIG